MKIIVILSNDEETHEEIDNIANMVAAAMENEGYHNVQQESHAKSIMVTCEKDEEEEEQEDEEEEPEEEAS